MIFVDSSAFIALLDADEEKHVDALAQWQAPLDNDEVLLTNNYVLVEMLALLHRRGGMAVVHRFIEDIVPLVSIEWIQPSLHNAAITGLMMSGRSGPNIVDCASFAVMHQLGISQVFTYDRHFEELGFTVLS
jgi:uncharacterized protein